ncbi:MAG: hypothetical protein CMK89_04750 [Pseudomonadales bacterium]|nr:hypothetical protein [Pseudomonadales bacterium]
MEKILKVMLGLALITTLSACGGSGSESGSGTGQLSLSITDAPVDGAKAVWITIDEVYLKHSSDNASEQKITLSGPDISPEGTLTVNLLDLSGGELRQLFNSETVPSGKYQWVRFGLVEDTAKIVWDDDTDSPLSMPANKNELKTSGSFTVAEDNSVAYIIDWDLRKSIVEFNKDQYKLKPVLHIKRDDFYAYVEGTVSDESFSLCGPEQVPAVYVFSGFDQTPDDIGGALNVVTSSYVRADAGHYFYVGPVDPAEYTFAFTCEAYDDDPEDDDNITFISTLNVALSSGSNSWVGPL